MIKVRSEKLKFKNRNLHYHRPVLLNEVIQILNLKRGKNIIDATCALGGHTKEIVKKIIPEGKVLAIDWDEKMLEKAKDILANFKKTIIFRHGNFANIKNILKDKELKKISWQGILFDFGYSLDHIKNSGRGFSFMQNEPLDMRYNLNNKLTAAQIINQYSKNDLAKIFYSYGEQKYSYKIAKAIVEARQTKKIETTKDLTNIILKVIPRQFPYKIHPATKVFQSLRIEVNDELENIKKGLSDGFDILQQGGVICAISFHSLEDRMVKNFFKEKKETHEAEILTKKPIIPSAEEVLENPSSRSAKLRALRKII